MKFLVVSLFVVLSLLVFGTQSLADPKASKPSVEAVNKIAAEYAKLVRETYANILTKNKELQQACERLTKEPSAENLKGARLAWQQARLVYSRSEPFRYYGGPIDHADQGVEGQLNAWPIDESYLDSVKDNPTAGMIQNLKAFPNLTPEVLRAANEKGGSTNVSTGYHAIEFLLWGQDFDLALPGQRSFEDFSVKKDHGIRRGQALMTLVGMVVSDTETLVRAWASNSTYEKEFLSQAPDEILRRIMVGLTSLSIDEMAGERLTVALEKNDPEHEQDCFSDFSLEDLKANQAGIAQILNQTGLLTLFQQVNSKKARLVVAKMQESQKNLESIPAPFDKIIADKKNKDRKKVNRAITSLQAQGQAMNQFAKIWGIELNVQAE